MGKPKLPRSINGIPVWSIPNYAERKGINPKTIYWHVERYIARSRKNNRSPIRNLEVKLEDPHHLLYVHRKKYKREGLYASDNPFPGEILREIKSQRGERGPNLKKNSN